MKNKDVDLVSHPPHYEGNTSLECIQVMEIAFGKDAVKNFCMLNAFKYMWRYKHKNGKVDLNKAKWYLDYYNDLEGRNIISTDSQFYTMNKLLGDIQKEVEDIQNRKTYPTKQKITE